MNEKALGIVEACRHQVILSADTCLVYIIPALNSFHRMKKDKVIFHNVYNAGHSF